MSITLLANLTASDPADVLLFHPTNPGIFVVGTYLLNESNRARCGRISVYTLTSLDRVTDPSLNARLNCETECDAVLDMKWYSGKLYVAHSTGSMSIYSCEVEAPQVKMILEKHMTCLDPAVLILSLSVSDRGILTSHSDGTTSCWTHDLTQESSWEVSQLEVWIQAWARESNTVFTGSDDGVFAAWDTRAGEAQFRNRKSHGAGVTAILPYGADHEIMTGSYDDKIRRFDLRNTARPVLETDLGGGVWRIVPKALDELLVCCMYDGAKVIQSRDFSQVKRFSAHESIVYGGDVAAEVIGTCSFYDRKICVWR